MTDVSQGGAYSGPMTGEAYSGPMTISPTTGKPVPHLTVTALPKGAPPSQGQDPWGAYTDVPVMPSGGGGGPSTGTPGAPAGDPWGAYVDDGSPTPPQKQFSTSEAVGKGVMSGVTFSFKPALDGLAAAAGPEYQVDDPYRPGEKTPSAAAPFVGAAKLFEQMFAQHPDPNVRAAYDAGREASLNDQNLARQQHPGAYIAGQLAGAVVAPIPGGGVMRAGTTAARAISGARAGAIAGGLNSTGEATSEGQSPGDVATAAGKGVVIGGALGGALGAAVGPRLPNPNSPGQAAARTAEALGAPIPQGLASDSRMIQGATSSTASVPFLGPRITHAVEQNTEAAGNALAGSGVQDTIDANRATIDAGYNGVRGMIQPDRVMPMPNTARAVHNIRVRRAQAGHVNPGEGLGQFDNIAAGASFNGAHRARVDAREAGDALTPHPGYNAADFNHITRAITADLRANLMRQGGGRAVRAFDRAERQFGPLSEANRFLNKIIRARGPDAGLDQLGYNPATDRFSLDKFVTAINKLNPQSRPFVMQPQHRAAVEAIFNMGTHLKGAFRTRNTSHTSNAMMLFEMAKTAVEMGVGISTGLIGTGSVLGGLAGGAPPLMFMYWLSRPATANAMSAWSRAYQGLLGSPTPARVAAFKLATRNLATNINVPVDRIMEVVQRRLAAPAEEQDQDEH